jgi:hypothetical protein
VLTPDFSRRDLERAAAPTDLARGRELAEQVEELDWDEYSVWGSLPCHGSQQAGTPTAPLRRRAARLPVTVAVCRRVHRAPR